MTGSSVTSSRLPGAGAGPTWNFLRRLLMVDMRAILFAAAPGSGDCKGGASAIRVLMAGS